MVKWFTVSFFLAFGGAILMFFIYIAFPQVLTQTLSWDRLSASPVPTLLPTPTPTPGLTPVTLIIPRLKIQAAVELVGVTETGNMDVPKNADHVAWYMYGPKPSEEGNSVVAGHYDTPTGKPAIFYKLGTLNIGDEIEVISENALHSKFVVTEKATIPYGEFPSEEVFKNRPGKNLNLITCGGIWDARQKTYKDRIVVYTTLKEGFGAL